MQSAEIHEQFNIGYLWCFTYSVVRFCTQAVRNRTKKSILFCKVKVVFVKESLQSSLKLRLDMC